MGRLTVVVQQEGRHLHRFVEVDFQTVIAAKTESMQSKRLLIDAIKGVTSGYRHSHVPHAHSA
jgi:hypothetical protein